MDKESEARQILSIEAFGVMLGVIMLLSIGGIVLGWRLLDSRMIVNCDTVGTYAAALRYSKTHSSLDRNKNGVPCEKLLKS